MSDTTNPAPMASRTVHVCISSASSFVIIDREGSTRDTHCAVLDVPHAVAAPEVIHKMNGIVFFPWPKEVHWPDIVQLKSGAVYKEQR